MVDVTDRHRQELKRNGFIVMQDVIDKDTITAAREAYWDASQYDPDDYEALIDAGNRLPGVWDDIENTEPFAEIVERTYNIAETFVGEDALSEPSKSLEIAARTPSGDVSEDDELPPLTRDRGHIDGYGPHFDRHHDVGYNTLNTATYLNTVEPRGGGFTVWPGSHWYAAEYYENHHLESLVDSPRLPAYEDGNWDRCGTLANQTDPLEIHGPAGTTVFWHGNLLHGGGTNNSPNVRLNAIKRLSRPDGDEIKRDAAANPFKYWPAMQDVELPF